MLWGSIYLWRLIMRTGRLPNSSATIISPWHVVVLSGSSTKPLIAARTTTTYGDSTNQKKQSNIEIDDRGR